MSRPQFHIPQTIVYTQEDGKKKVFILNEELGHGSFAIVYKVTLQGTKKVYAMKIISKEPYLKSKNTYEKLKTEVEVQTIVDHPNTVRSKYSFSDEFNYYLVLEYCPGKSIREYLHGSPNGRLKESDTKKILIDVINGLIYLHNLHITHYDLKLENFIIDSEGNVKIGDFGLSNFRKNEEGKKYSISGTPNYLSPEILNKEVKEDSSKVDIWAIGISAFILLTGRGPFEGANKDITFENIKKGQFYFPINYTISQEAKNFIQSTLQTDPHKRPTASELIKHPFLTKPEKETIKLNRSIILPQLVKPSQKVPSSPRQPNRRLPPIVPTSPRQSVRMPFSPRENKQKNFNVPSYFVSRFCFYNEDMAYILGDGTVGICFKDQSRIVMDPNEKFVHFFKSQYSNTPEVIELFDKNIENETKNISMLRKIANSLKKVKISYDMPKNEYDHSKPLHHVKCFVMNDDSILFRMNDKNLQVNFNDHVKMIIFWSTKKLCFLRNIKEKCNLMDLKCVASMNANSDELKKFKKAKMLLSNWAITLC